MKKRTTLFKISLLSLLILSTLQLLKGSQQYYYYDVFNNQSGAKVPFTKGNVSDALTKTIADFFDETEELNKTELYRYLGHPNIATGKPENNEMGLQVFMRMPTFIEQLMSSREAFLSSGTKLKRKKQLTDFMEALLQHGNIQTTVGCLVDGSDSRCPCCKFDNDILLNIFIESVANDSSLTSKIYNAKLAAIILLFIKSVKKDNLQEVDDFIVKASGKDKYTLLDVRIRSLLALLNYSITISKTETPSLDTIHQENAFILANELAEKFLNEKLVDTSFLFDPKSVDLQHIEDLKIELKTKIDINKALLIGRIPNDETKRLEEEIRKTKQYLLSLEVPLITRAAFYCKYLKEFGEHIKNIATALKSNETVTQSKRDQLIHNGEILLKLIPEELFQVFNKSLQSSSVDITEFGNAASKSKAILLEKISLPHESSKVNVQEFGSTVSENKTKFSVAQPEQKKHSAPAVLKKPIATTSLVKPSEILPAIISIPTEEKVNQIIPEEVIIQKIASPKINTPEVALDKEFLLFIKNGEKLDSFKENSDFNTFLSSKDAPTILAIIQESQPKLTNTQIAIDYFDISDADKKNKYSITGMIMKTLITLLSYNNKNQNIGLLIELLNSSKSLLQKSELPAGSLSKVKAFHYLLEDNNPLTIALNDLIEILS